jgi:hypothetical protein
VNFLKFFFLLLVAGFPAIMLFSCGLIAFLAPLAILAKSEKPPAILMIPIIVLAGAFQIYFWGAWSAFCVSVAYRFTSKPEVTWDWFYFVTGFFESMSLIGWFCHKERMSRSVEDRQSIATGTMWYSLVAIAAYIVFAIWPHLTKVPYGWFLRFIGLEIERE